MSQIRSRDITKRVSVMAVTVVVHKQSPRVRHLSLGLDFNILAAVLAIVSVAPSSTLSALSIRDNHGLPPTSSFRVSDATWL
jgi:hypothetical protein